MTKIISILAMLFAIALPAMAETIPTTEAAPAAAEEEQHGLGFWVETRTVKGGSSEMVVYFDKSLTDSVGFYAQVVKDSSGYASVYAGPKFKIAEGVEVGVGVGRERSRGETSTTVRNAWLFADGEKFSLYATVEKGVSGTWHKAILLHKLTDTTNVGVMNESFLGTGPRLEHSITKTFQVWGALLRSHGKTTPVLAANVSF